MTVNQGSRNGWTRWSHRWYIIKAFQDQILSLLTLSFLKDKEIKKLQDKIEKLKEEIEKLKDGNEKLKEEIEKLNDGNEKLAQVSNKTFWKFETIT